MAIPSGISAQLMIAAESTWGTPVTPTRGFEFVSERVKNNIQRIESRGLRAGTRVLRSDRWEPGSQKPGGPISMELHNKSFGLWLQHAFGQNTITTPGGGTLTRDHTCVPADLPAGLTVQVGRTDEAGTVHPFTYAGARIATWELSARVGEIVMLDVDVLAEDETTATGLAAATYATSTELLVFTGATLTIAGSAVDVTSFSLKGDNGLDGDRDRLGSALRKQPLEVAQRVYDGTVEAYFNTLTAYNRFVNGTEAALVIACVGSNIEGALNYGLTVTCNVRFDGETPEVSGPDELMQPLPFKCLDTGSGPSTAITAVYRTTDTAA